MRILFTYKKTGFTPIRFGLLYNFNAYGHANFAMPGWSVPEISEATVLIDFLGGVLAAGIPLREPDLTFWQNLNGCDNSSGLTMRGAGIRRRSGSFLGLMINGYIMSRTIPFFVRNYSVNTNNFVSLSNARREQGRPIYLLKDDGIDPGSYVDYEGHVYPTIKIGSQVWTARYQITQFLNDGTPIPEVTDNAAWGALLTPGLCAYNNNWGNV